MWPWGHLAVGYLAYSGLRRTWTTLPVSKFDALAVAFGTQFPDVIDKPLAWLFGVLPAGRSLTHSLLTASVLLAIAYEYCRRNDSLGLWAAFAVGYLSHPFADALQPALLGEYRYVTFLLWPVLPLPPNPAGLSPRLSGYLLFELLLVVVAIAVWLSDGAPGVDLFLPSDSAVHRER